MNLFFKFNILITNYFRIIGVTKSPHQESPKVCFLLKGDIASPILYTCPTKWTAYSDVTSLPKQVCLQTLVTGFRRNRHTLWVGIDLVGTPTQILCWQTSTHKDYARMICNKWTQLRFSDWTKMLIGLTAPLTVFVIASNWLGNYYKNSF